MGTFVKRDVIVAWFPTSGGDQFKKRPAVVVASMRYFEGDDYLLCLISTQEPPDAPIIKLQDIDILGGSLKADCFIHPAYLFAAREEVIEYKVGTLRGKILAQVVATIVQIVSS